MIGESKNALFFYFLLFAVGLIFLLSICKNNFYYWSTFDERYRERKVQYARPVSVREYDQTTGEATRAHLRELERNT